MSLSNKELRRQLFDADPKCFWCGRTCRWIEKEGGGTLPPDAATLDHLYTRYEMEKRKSEGNPTVLACNQCNHDRGEEATSAQPIQELWRRAGQLERMLLEGRVLKHAEA